MAQRLHERGIFCNRTLNMRAIRAIGYDMDYTLVHYHAEAWELRAYEHVRRSLAARGWPVEGLRFSPDLVIRGLIVDKELGNVVKTNRFGYVRRAFHGTAPLEFDEQRRVYARCIVDLDEPRFAPYSTLFALSEACMYMQLVDLYEAGVLSEVGGYAELYQIVRDSIDHAHMEGALKSEISSDPERFVVLDAETPLTLLDQRAAGKKLALITNSEIGYTRAMMSFAFDRFLPAGETWRDLFDVVVVGAHKPEFFSERRPICEIDLDGAPVAAGDRQPGRGAWHSGGDAAWVEKHLGVSGDEILYVGDHILADVHVSKSFLRWRTALVLRELESEIAAAAAARATERRLAALMQEKEALEHELCHLRLLALRRRAGHGPEAGPKNGRQRDRMDELRLLLDELDDKISPLAKAAAETGNKSWGMLMRAGNDKSHLARQVERSADIYTSRVSNFLSETPFVYLRSPRTTLPHDPVEIEGTPDADVPTSGG